MEYNIRVQLINQGGYRRFFVVDAMVLNLNPVKELRHVNRKKRGISIWGHIEHEDAQGNIINSLTSKQFSFTASDKLADPTNGRVEPPLIEDTDSQSETFGEMIPDPSFSPSVEEFVLLAETTTSGGTLWQEVSGLIDGLIESYVTLVQDYGRFEN